MPTTTPTVQPRRAATAFILVTVGLDVIALGIVIPVLPKLVESMAGGDTARAAELYGVFGTAWALMQLVSAPVLGALSDRFGRRPVLLLSVLGLGLDYVLMAVAPSLVWLFIGRVLSGITAATFSTANAYIADVTPPERRAAAFGLMGAAFGLGFVLGPAIGGIAGDIDPRLPFWIAAGLALANFVYGLLALPESLPRERRMPFSWARANPVGSLRLLAEHRQLIGLAGVLCLSHLAHVVLPAVSVLYTGYRYGWDSKTMGLTLAGVGIAAVIVQVWMIKPAIRHLGERNTLIVGLVSGMAGFFIYGLAATGLMFWAGIPVQALWGMAGAAAMALMSRLVSASEQGQLQGGNASLMALAGLLGPGLFSQIFARSIAADAGWHLPGAAFLLAGAMLAVATALAWRVTRPAAQPESPR